MDDTEDVQKERFPSPPNLPPGETLAGRGFFFLRKMADLQVASVVHHLTPWLCERDGSILEVGCGAQPYRHLIPASCAYQGLDWEQAEAYFAYRAPDTVYYAGGQFPFADGMFDSLFHTEVIEHVYHYELFLKECRRVLKSGGSMFFTVPFQARYHYIPFDYWRFTPAALKKLVTGAGFKDVVVTPRGTDITVAAYKTVSLTYRWLQGDVIEKLLGIFALPVSAVALSLGHISLRWGIGSQDDCLGYSVTACASTS
jgi:SAM-dependent methyltransferase